MNVVAWRLQRCTATTGGCLRGPVQRSIHKRRHRVWVHHDGGLTLGARALRAHRPFAKLHSRGTARAYRGAQVLRWVLAVVVLLLAESAYAQFESVPVTSGTVGQLYVYQAHASNQGQGNVQIIAPNGLPAWLTLIAVGSSDATLSGTPPAPGTYNVMLSALSTSCLFLPVLCPSQTFDIVVPVPPPANLPPMVVPPGIADQTTPVLEPFMLDVRAAFSDPDLDALTFSATGLPPGLTMTNGVIAGTPTTSAGSPFVVIVTASDGRGGTVSDELSIAVSPNGAPTIVGAGVPDQSVTVNEALRVDVAPFFRDPDGDSLTFSVAGLPAGFDLAGTVISGTPGIALEAGSPFTVNVTARDDRNGSVTDRFVLTVVPLARADAFIAGIEVSPTPAVRNAAVTSVITLGNHGPAPTGALDVTVEFAGNPFTFVSNPCVLSVAADRQQLACGVGPIASGATATVTLSGTAAQPGDVYVTAAVAGDTAVPIDPNVTNNRGVLTLTVGETVATDAAQAIALPATAAAAGDVNGDGFADLVLVANGAEPAVLLNIENPTALHPSLAQEGAQRRGLASIPLVFGTAAQGADVALADLDNDQDLDVIVANGPGAPSAAFRNDGGGVFTQMATLGGAGRNDRAVAVADLDGDTLADIVIAAANGNFLYLNQNGSYAQSALPNANGVGAVDVALVDVVGSALPDLVFVNANGATVRYENMGGTFGAAATIDAGPSVGVASADFNRDGRADLVLARAAANAPALPSNPVYLNNNAGGFLAVGALGAAPTTAVSTGDADGDGFADVLAVNSTGAQHVYLGDGNGNFRLHSQIFVSAGAVRGAIAPIGRLRRGDLVLAGADNVHVFFNDARGALGLGDTTAPVITLNGTPEIILEVGGAYEDPGANATDDVDGALTPAVSNPVDAAVIGTYTVTYSAVDTAGNAALPVTRTVRVNAREAQGGGGGAAGLSLLALLAAALALRCARRPIPVIRR